MRRRSGQEVAVIAVYSRWRGSVVSLLLEINIEFYGLIIAFRLG